MELSRTVSAQFCNYELSLDQCMKINWDILGRRGNIKPCGVSGEFEILQEQKPDRDCDEWGNGSLTESVIASIEEENAIDPKFGIKKSD